MLYFVVVVVFCVLVSEEKTKDLYVVILADVRLLGLPLESLPQFRQQFNIVSLSRDFSLQILKHRLAKHLPEDGGSLNGKGWTKNIDLVNYQRV